MSKTPSENPAAGQPPLSFEQAMAQLERIIGQIENGEVGLEESIARYEQGVKLITHCRSVLDRAEKKIRELGVTQDGGLEETGEESPPGGEEGVKW